MSRFAQSGAWRGPRGGVCANCEAARAAARDSRTNHTTDPNVAVDMTSQVVRSIADSVLRANGPGDARDLARRATLAGARAAFLAGRGLAPETAARLALKRAFPDVSESEWMGELEEEVERRGMTVHLSWSRAPVSHAEILAKRKALRGGVYIKVSATGRPLKVGKAIDFQDRPGTYPSSSRFWIATIDASLEKDPTGIVEAVEHAVARTLMRLGYGLGQHHLPRSELKTRKGHKIIIRNLLPAPFLGSVGGAYGRPVKTKHTPPRPPPSGVKTPVSDKPGGSYAAPAERGALVLTPSMSWEAIT